MDARDPVARRANHVASLRFNRSNVKPSAQKYFASVFLKIMISFAHPAPARRDVSADRHDTWGGDAMDALRPPDERGAMRTAKSRGPGAPTLASSLLVTNRQATETNKPGTPGRSRISRKPLRRECRLFRLPCVACVRKSALSLHARLAGAACIRHSLRPLHFARVIIGKTRANHAARMRSHVLSFTASLPSRTCSPDTPRAPRRARGAGRRAAGRDAPRLQAA